MPVSVVVPIKNEAQNLPRCLASVGWADEIFVVDSQSTDGSQRIAEEFGARVVQFEFNGTWPKKKNWALENLPFRNEWVFILDADEVLPAEAETEFRTAIANAGETVYWINRRFMFMGRWLRHAYYPNWNLRLFRHSLGRYEKLTEVATASGDNEVHEHVIVQGSTAGCAASWITTRFPRLRFSSKNTIVIPTGKRVSRWPGRARRAGRVTKRTGRATAQAEDAFAAAAVSSALALPLRLRLAAGFLDGREGYYFARMHAFLRVPLRRQDLRVEKALGVFRRDAHPHIHQCRNAKCLKFRRPLLDYSGVLPFRSLRQPSSTGRRSQLSRYR